MVKEDRLFVLREHEHAVKNEATLEAFHIYRRTYSTGYDIRLRASKPLFHAPWVRGGKSTEVRIGVCRNLVNAEGRVKEINNLIKELDKHAASKRQAKEGKEGKDQKGQAATRSVKTLGGPVRDH